MQTCPCLPGPLAGRPMLSRARLSPVPVVRLSPQEGAHCPVCTSSMKPLGSALALPSHHKLWPAQTMDTGHAQ